MTCTFFGHRDTKTEIEPILKATIIDLIENNNVKSFYVGNNGNFDSIVGRVLKELSAEYDISYRIVLAYMPTENDKLKRSDYSDTILPDGIETVPKRFAISFRNKWMIEQSDYVITYVTNEIASGAAQFKKKAQKQNKHIIELSLTNQ